MWCNNTPRPLFSIALLIVVRLSLATPLFELQDIYIGDSFFDGFNYSTFDDPTHGRVNFVSQEQAIEKNLSYASPDKFVMRADYTHKVPPDARGRDSVRIQSRAAYSDSLIILDLTHMPEGCSTWPAFWTISAAGPWPYGGEIDGKIRTRLIVIEGVNRATRNLASLHTTPGCTMSDPRPMTGQTISTNCDAKVNSNQGCGVSFSKPNSYGSAFNAAGGGWYVMQRTADHGVSVWFWSRNDPSVPHAVAEYNNPLVQPDHSWGEPEAYFPPTSCSADHFNEHQIIFDLTLCGDWAGSVYGTSGCPGTCVDFVDNNPQAFADAYWEINALRVYTPVPWDWRQ